MNIDAIDVSQIEDPDLVDRSPAQNVSDIKDPDIESINVDDIQDPDRPLGLKEGANKYVESTKALLSEIPKAVTSARQNPDNPFGQALNTLDDMGVMGALETGLETGKEALSGAANSISPMLSAGDRLIGTGYAYLADKAAGSNLVDEAKKRDIALNLNVVDGKPQSRLLPVSLTQDVVQRPLEDSFKLIGADLMKSDNKAVKALGETVEFAGPAVAAGMAVGADLLNPIYGFGLGRLTKVGQALAAEGELASGIGRQIQQGERTALSWKLPLVEESYRIPIPRTLENSAITAIQDAQIRLEATKIGQKFRNYTTRTGWVGFDAAMANHAIDRTLVQDDLSKFLENTNAKAKMLGVDLGNQEVRKELYDWLDNPKTTKLNLIDENQAQSIFQTLEERRKMAVARAEEVGLPIPEFSPKSLVDQKDAGLYSEQYVPRGTTASTRQLKQVKEVLGDIDGAEEIAESVTNPGSGKRVDTTFKLERSKYNRNAMNNIIKDRLGVDNFFHDDPVLAYAQKIESIEKAVADKKILNSVLQEYPTSRVEWVKIRNSAQARVEAAKMQGMIPHPDDVRLAMVDLEGLKILDPAVSNKLKTFERADPKAMENVSRVVVPGPVADVLNQAFVSPKFSTVESVALAYNRVWKNAVLFNPGFIMRNAWEEGVRSAGLGTKLSSMAEATKASVFGKGSWVKYNQEFDSMLPKFGRMTDPTKYVPNLEAKALEVSKKFFNEENPMLRGHSTIHEMAAKGKVGQWIKTLKETAKGKGLFEDNAWYRHASNINESGEKVFKLARYAELREAGYSPRAAMLDVKRNFIDFSQTRNSVRKLQAYVPFSNYMLKNAESTMKILAQNPRNVSTYGPGGALERAIEQWAGWDPSQVNKFRELFPGWHSDAIMGPMQPGGDKVIQEKDGIKRLLTAWMGPEMAGNPFWVKLPSNYHGLLMMDPTKANEMAGPLVKAAVTLLGIDPFTGKQFVGANLPGSSGSAERLAKLGEALGSGFVPNNVIDAARAEVNKHWPAYEKNMLNLGFPDATVKFLMGDKTDAAQKKMQKSLSIIKGLWMGRISQLDIDTYLRINADMMSTKREWDALIKQKAIKGSDKDLDQTINRAVRSYQKMVDRVTNLIDVRNDYDDRVIKAGGTPQAEINFNEGDMKELSPNAEPAPTEQEQKSAEDSIIDSMDVNDIQDPDRTPQGKFEPSYETAEQQRQRINNINVQQPDEAQDIVSNNYQVVIFNPTPIAPVKPEADPESDPMFSVVGDKIKLNYTLNASTYENGKRMPPKEERIIVILQNKLNNYLDVLKKNNKDLDKYKRSIERLINDDALDMIKVRIPPNMVQTGQIDRQPAGAKKILEETGFAGPSFGASAAGAAAVTMTLKDDVQKLRRMSDDQIQEMPDSAGKDLILNERGLAKKKDQSRLFDVAPPERFKVNDKDVTVIKGSIPVLGNGSRLRSASQKYDDFTPDYLNDVEDLVIDDRSLPPVPPGKESHAVLKEGKIDPATKQEIGKHAIAHVRAGLIGNDYAAFEIQSDRFKNTKDPIWHQDALDSVINRALQLGSENVLIPTGHTSADIQQHRPTKPYHEEETRSYGQLNPKDTPSDTGLMNEGVSYAPSRDNYGISRSPVKLKRVLGDGNEFFVDDKGNALFRQNDHIMSYDAAKKRIESSVEIGKRYGWDNSIYNGWIENLTKAKDYADRYLSGDLKDIEAPQLKGHKFWYDEKIPSYMKKVLGAPDKVKIEGHWYYRYRIKGESK